METVKECKNKECRFGEQSCWYHHANKVNLEKKDNQEITEKIFNMMETFTNRIVNIENHINHENWKDKITKWNKIETKKTEIIFFDWNKNMISNK